MTSVGASPTVTSAMTRLVAVSITLTVDELWLATKTYCPPAAIPHESLPTGMLATIVSVSMSMTSTVPFGQLTPVETYARPPAMATSVGSFDTETVATTEFVLVLITLTDLERLL